MDIIGYFSTHQRSRKTRIAYEQDLEQFGEYVGIDFELRSLRGTTIEAWAAHLRTLDYAPASMRRKIVVLKVFCGYWLRRGVLNESPFWRVKLVSDEFSSCRGRFQSQKCKVYWSRLENLKGGT